MVRTKPDVILNEANCRYESQHFSFSFLMIDDTLDNPDVDKLARKLVEYGLHGLDSVVTIWYLEQLPVQRNISVGVAAFRLCSRKTIQAQGSAKTLPWRICQRRFTKIGLVF